jgi:hypothetical protein
MYAVRMLILLNSGVDSCALFLVDLEPEEKSNFNLLNTFFCLLSGSLRK